MPNPATFRKRRLRMTKAQLIDEIEKLEQSAPEIEAAKTTDRRFVNQALADLARIPAENPHPVLRVMLDGTVLYANDAAISVSGLLTGRKTPKLARDLAGVCAEASHSAEVREVEFESGNLLIELRRAIGVISTPMLEFRLEPVKLGLQSGQSGTAGSLFAGKVRSHALF